MGAVICRRVLVGIPVIIGVTVLAFFTLRILPGDPTTTLLDGVAATPHEVAQLKHQLGLDQPITTQYWDFVTGAFHGDLGRSFTTQQSVTDMISSQALATVELTVVAVLLTTVIGVSLGVLAALRRDTWVDGAIRAVSLLGTAMPVFWTGLLLMMVFSFRFHLLPATGSSSPEQLILPAIALAFLASGLVIRLVRTSMLEILGEKFVLALHAKGLRPRIVVVRHVLRNALIPAVTVIGLQVGSLLSGAVVTEVVFARQGLGRLLITAIKEQDFPTIQGAVLVIAVVYVVVNIVVDVSYAYLDPRIRTAMEN